MMTRVARVVQMHLQRRVADILNYDYAGPSVRENGGYRKWRDEGDMRWKTYLSPGGKPAAWEPTDTADNGESFDLLMDANPAPQDVHEPLDRMYDQPAVDIGEYQLIPETGFDEGFGGEVDDLDNKPPSPGVMRDEKWDDYDEDV